MTINDNLPPILQFRSATYTVSASSSSALVTVTRGGSGSSTVQVNYAAAGGTAIGRGRLTPRYPERSPSWRNQTTATFTVPILHPGTATASKTVGLALSNPAGGAQLGSTSTATLTITAGSTGSTVNPGGPVDTIPPKVTGEQLVLGPAGITAVVFSFSKPLDPNRAVDLGNYGYYAIMAGRDGVYGTSDDGFIRIAAAQYNPATSSVAVILSSPVPFGGFARITIDALASPLLNRGLTDTSGNLLSGQGNGIAGSPFITTFAAGPQLTYSDTRGKTVSLSLTGGGVIEMFRTPAGDPQNVLLVGAVPRRSVLTLTAGRGGAPYTILPTIQGAGGVRFRYRPGPAAFRPPGFKPKTSARR